MPNLWVSSCLTTQDWVSNRADFLFESMVAHLSGYWSSASTDQLQYGQILHSIAEEIANLDRYSNWLGDQTDADNLDPTGLHLDLAYHLDLSSEFPRPAWYDTDYRTFLIKLSQTLLEGSSVDTVVKVFDAYAKVNKISTSIQVDELWKMHGSDSTYNIVDQHVAHIQLPNLSNITQTSRDILGLFEKIRPAHTVFRLVLDPLGKADYIHTATLSDTFYLKIYHIEERPTAQPLKWSVTNGWFSSSDDLHVFSPGVFPSARYKVSWEVQQH